MQSEHSRRYIHCVIQANLLLLRLCHMLRLRVLVPAMHSRVITARAPIKLAIKETAQKWASVLFVMNERQ